MSKKASKEPSYGLFGVYPSLLGIARDAGERCLENANRSDALTAVVFSVVTLEAFINELGAQAQSDDTNNQRIRCFAELMKNLEDSRERLQTKYQLGYFALTGKTCPKGTQVFQDFATLIRLRNELVHYKAQKTKFSPGTLKVSYDPPKLVKHLADRGLIPKPSLRSDMPFMSRVGTPGVAVWAVNTAVKMIGTMHDAIPAGQFREMQLFIRYPDQIGPKAVDKQDNRHGRCQGDGQ